MRSPLYEKAEAVVAAYDSDLAGDHWVDAVDHAIRALRDELGDQALAVLGIYRESLSAESPHGTGRP